MIITNIKRDSVLSESNKQLLSDLLETIV